MKLNYLLAIMGVVVFGCTQKADEQRQSSNLEYASKFDINGDTLTVIEPWPGAQNAIHYFFDKVPGRVIVTSTTHLPYLELLGQGDKLVGFPGMQYVSSEYFRKRYENGQIKDIGGEGNINLELVFDLNPDVVIAFDMGSESSMLDKLSEAGIKVIYNADFLETSALGRTEWIKFFGEVFDEQKRADSIFATIANNYKLIKNKVENVEEKPTVFSGVMYGDAWFMPGGKNWSAEFFTDAGGNYLWSETDDQGWLEVSFESVYQKAYQADYWIGTSTFKSLNELKNQDDRYAAFDAYQDRKVYNYSKRTNPNGGYDFFESGYSRPDLVLKDLVNIMHPGVLADEELYYFERLR